MASFPVKQIQINHAIFGAAYKNSRKNNQRPEAKENNSCASGRFLENLIKTERYRQFLAAYFLDITYEIYS